MSTSCTYGFYKNGDLKVDYNNSDSYPSGFGKHIVAFIRENTIDELNELYDKMVVVPRKEVPNEIETQNLKSKGIYIDSSEDVFNWEHISVFNESFLEYYKLGVYFIPDFSQWFYAGHDWAYLINLDDNTFEVYSRKYSKDENEEQLREFNRYSDKYTLRGKFSLDKIPRDWNRLVG